MRRLATSPQQRGFTLLELLIAIAIFVVVSALAMGGFNELSKHRERAQASMTRTRQIQRAVRQLTTDMRLLEPRPVRDPTAILWNPALYSVTSNCLVELTRSGWSNPVNLPRSSLQRVCYQLQNGSLIRRYWTVLDRTLATKPVEISLLDKVTSIKFRYLDNNRQWQTEWPAQSVGGGGAQLARRLPMAVEITLTLEDWGEIRRIVEVAS